MSFPDKVVPVIDRRLNPHAEEFVPFSLKSPSGRSILERGTSFGVSGTAGNPVISQSESPIAHHSDDELHLPDDITPDIDALVQDYVLHSGNNFSSPSLSPHASKEGSFTNKIGSSCSSFSEAASSSNLLNPSAKPWEKRISNTNRFMSLVSDKAFYNGCSNQGLIHEQSILGNTEMNPLEYLGSRFPGFPSENLKEVYFANGGDLNVTIEMLQQLQADGGLNHNRDLKALPAPNVTSRDYPALSIRDGLNSLPNNASPYQPSNNMFNSNPTLPTRGAIDFGTALRETLPQDSASIWKFEKRGSADVGSGSSRSPQVLASSHNGGPGRGMYSSGVPNRSTSRAAPWLETGDAIENMITALRGEARNNAHMRDLGLEKFERAVPHHANVMKVAHDKAEEIHHQRNPIGPEMPNNNGRVRQERIIDLQNLHLPEAIHVLKRELAMLRTAARSANMRLHVYICVGIDHPTRGPRSPARLPVAVQRYLPEEEEKSPIN